MQLGDFCTVGEGVVMNAATVGNFVRFGNNCYVGMYNYSFYEGVQTSYSFIKTQVPSMEL